jgi:phage-related protein
MSKQARKPIKWVSSAKRDLDAMPQDVKDVFGHAIDLAQAGGKHQDAKVMTGFGSAGVLEWSRTTRATLSGLHRQVRRGSMSCIAFRRSPKAASRRRNRK